jgi:phosphoserine phosphatase
MPTIVCVIAAPEKPLEAGAVQAAAEAVDGRCRWLADEAVEIETGAPPAQAAEAVAGHIGRDRADVVGLAPVGARIKRLLVSDMDSTIVTVECIDELAARAGIGAEVSAITRRAMNGEIDFEQALTERVRLLEGLPIHALEEVYRDRVRLMPGAAALVHTMRQLGARTVLLSGGFTFFTERVARQAGFDDHFGNVLEVRNGLLTGRVVPHVYGPQGKLESLETVRRSMDISLADTLAVGDGANDLPMLHAAGLGVAFRPHPAVAAQVSAVIRHGDLTALLYLQGIPKAQFATV